MGSEGTAPIVIAHEDEELPEVVNVWATAAASEERTLTQSHGLLPKALEFAAGLRAAAVACGARTGRLELDRVRRAQHRILQIDGERVLEVAALATLRATGAEHVAEHVAQQIARGILVLDPIQPAKDHPSLSGPCGTGFRLTQRVFAVKMATYSDKSGTAN